MSLSYLYMDITVGTPAVTAHRETDDHRCGTDRPGTGHSVATILFDDAGYWELYLEDRPAASGD